MGQHVSHGSAVGRVAVITGGASGIGLAAAKRCAAMGMKVVIADVAELAGAEAAVAASAPGATVLGIRCDVGDLSSVERLKRQVYAHPSLGEVGFLFSNAGVTRGESGSVLHTPLESWHSTFAVNVYGALHCLQCFVPAMQAQGTECVVVTTSSYSGLLNTSPGGFGIDVSYSASKHALTILTEALAHELRSVPANKVSVHCLFPAGVKTNVLENAQQALLQGVTDEAQRAKKAAAYASSRTKASLEASGLSPDELVQVLHDGVSEGKFYIRAFDRSASSEVFGAMIMERAKDIVLQREPISLDHPDAGVREPAVLGIREALRAQRSARPRAKL